MIYVVRTVCTKYVKVGFSDGIHRLKRRVATIQSACPLEIELIAFGEGTLQDEQAILIWLAPNRVRGEWFHGRKGNVPVFCNVASDVGPVSAFHMLREGVGAYIGRKAIEKSMQKSLRTLDGTPETDLQQGIGLSH